MAIVEDRKRLEKALEFVGRNDPELYAKACADAGIKPKAFKVEETADVIEITDANAAPEDTPPAAA